MRWSERMSLALETFKRVALPIYGWYIIFAFAGLGLMIAGLLPWVLPLMNIHRSFPGPFPNPNPPMPPGSISPRSFPFGGNFGSSLTFTPHLLLLLAVIVLVVWLGASAFMTGLFHLTRKGLHEKVMFRDFRMSGMTRVLGWYGILTLIVVLLLGAGAIAAFAFRETAYILMLFAGLYVLVLVALGLFLAPWLSTSAFYMLNHRELSFARSLNRSWDFYRRNMGSLWLFFITMLGIQILLSMINRSSPFLGLLVTLFAIPFTAILPIVWVLSLEEEESHGTFSPVNDPSQGAPSSLSPSETVDKSEPTMPPDPGPSEPPFPEYPSSPENIFSPEELSSSGKLLSPEDTLSPENPPTLSPRQTNPPSEPASSAAPTTPAEPSLPPELPSQPLPLATREAPPPAAVNYCPTCGQKARPGARYCSQCGTKL